MEEVMSFEEWYATDPNKKIREQKYAVSYDEKSRTIRSVGPAAALHNEEHVIVVEKEFAFDLLEGRKKIFDFFVDFDENGDLVVIEKQQLSKVDDVIHKIAPLDWIQEEIDFDIYLTHSKKDNIIKIELSEAHGGTRKLKTKSYPRRTVWSGTTKIKFFVTGYNDPHIIYNIIEVSLNDLLGKSKVADVGPLPEKFSVYTIRVFKNYVVEYK